MDNQHRKIKGYRELSQEEIDLMNDIKEQGAMLALLIQRIGEHPNTDQRWLSIARTDFQTGGMALTRSVARPDFFF